MGERQIAKLAAFDLEADGDNHSSRLAHEPIHRQKRPLMVSAAGKKEGGRQVIRQLAKVAAFILAQFAQQLAELGRGMVAQLGFLGGELGSVAVGKRIGSVEDVIEESERSFDLEVVRGASAAGRLLIELPYPFYREGFEDEAFGRRPRDDFEPGAPVVEE